MMKKSSIRKVLSLIGCMVLIAAMALSFTGCSTGKPNETPAETGESVTFQFVVTDPDGKDTTFDITSDKKTVGEALQEEGLIEGEMGDAKMGLQARLMSQALRKLTASISKTNTCCIFINQLRDKIGVMFGNPETTTGGNALKFYASVRVDVRRTTQIKDGEEALGNRTRGKIVKNKLAPPFKKAEFDIVFGEGISHVGEVIDLGVEFDIIKKSGSWFSYNDSKLAQGREAVKQLLADNVELCDEIEGKIREALKAVKD